MRNCSRLSKKGFTLIEVLVVSVLLSTALIIIMQAMGLGISGFRKTRHLLNAASILDEQMHALESASYQKSALTLESARQDIERTGVTYQWRVSRTDSDFAGLNRAEGELTWMDRQNERQMKLPFWFPSLVESTETGGA